MEKGTARVSIVIQLPDFEVKRLLQLLRTWEGGRSEIDMAVKIETDLPSKESLEDIFNAMDPPLPFKVLLEVK